PDVAPHHCFIENTSGLFTLHPCGNLCAVDGVQVQEPTPLTQGSMLCFGQSSLFRFNHPEEALRMKNRMDYGLYSESLSNGNQRCRLVQPHPAPGGGVQSEHSSIVSSIARDLQEIMDSLVLDESRPPPSSEDQRPPEGPTLGHTSLSPLVNGGGRYRLSPPTSPGAMEHLTIQLAAWPLGGVAVLL
uniref:FHA domain-containing protein n=1 Tax=Gouania willdenowi TaxID=441366 RepID=A0A8C5ECP0_GOUWI